MAMRELQNLLKQFLSREIVLDDLQRGFANLLTTDPDLAASAAAWIDAGEKDGLLSAAVSNALKSVLITQIAASSRRPNPRDSGIFDTPDFTAMNAGSAAGANENASGNVQETFVRDADSTVMGSDTDAERLAARSTGNSSGTVDVELTIGSIVGGRYELLSQLGSGGMGMVFKARDRLRAEAQDRNPNIALKVLSERFKEHPDSMIALQRESRRAQTLAHPNVITVHEFFRDGPHFYMTMELLDGKPLDLLLQSDYSSGLEFADAWPIIEGVGRALEYGHQKGIVHSDIKPGNIFVCTDGTVKVLDLGISRPIPVADRPQAEQTAFDPGTRLGSLTPAYASLEMWHQDVPDPRDDIYALGCVCYLLLTGRHPFDGQSAREAFDQNLEPTKIEKIARSQWNALAHALQFRRTERAPSVRHILDRLAPQSVVRSKRRTAIYIGALVAIVVGAFGVRFYGLAMENRTMVDRGRMATQAAEIPPPRTDLTAAEKDEIESLMSIAAFQFASIPEDANAEELTYLLSLGPNSVVPLTDSVLGVDPGHKGAWALREQAFELYLKAAGARRDAKDYATAMSLSRSADEVTPNTSAVLRLQRSICDDSPEVCAGR
jgi:serine/threonine protein kinase